MRRSSFVLAACIVLLSPARARTQAAGESADPAGTPADEASPSRLFRWSDRHGVPHLTNAAPKEYEVSAEEWLRLKAEYPGLLSEEVGEEPSDDLAELPPGRRAELALQRWWSLAAGKGAYRGHASVTPDEKTELDRLLFIARDALREARGKDLSPATGRAATEYRRARAVDLSVRDAAERAGLTADQLFPVTLQGKLVRGVSSVRYEVAGRVANRTLSDVPGLSVSVYLELDGQVIAAREVAVRYVMARGEAPLSAAFDLSARHLRFSKDRLRLRTHVERAPELPPAGG